MNDVQRQMKMMQDADPAPIMSKTMEAWREMLTIDAARDTIPTDDHIRKVFDRCRARAVDPTMSDRAQQVARVSLMCEASVLAMAAEFRAKRGSMEAPNA